LLNLLGNQITVEQAAVLSEIQNGMIKSKGNKGIMMVIDFDDELNALHNKLATAIRRKNKFLSEISQDFIDLLEVEVIGSELLQKREEIEK